MGLKVDLSVSLGPLKLKNPILSASGCFGFGEEYSSLLDLNLLGGLITKAVTLNPTPGNPPPRVVETPCGMLNSIGLANPGLKAFIEGKLPFLRALAIPIIVNVAGEKREEYVQVVKGLEEEEGVDGYEINISCPNVEKGGMEFSADPKITFELVSSLREATPKPLIIKLSPNLGNITSIAQAAQEAGADAASLINTLIGMAIDVKTGRPILARITGGLSGPAIKPVALALVWRVAQTVEIPLVGVGGIFTPEDALEFILAGATAVQVGTANFVDPLIMPRIIEGLKDYCVQEKIGRLSDLIGGLEMGVKTYHGYPRADTE